MRSRPGNGALLTVEHQDGVQHVVVTRPFDPVVRRRLVLYGFFFFFNDTATTEIYTNLNTLSLHDALPIYSSHIQKSRMPSSSCDWSRSEEHTSELQYAVFCL